MKTLLFDSKFGRCFATISYICLLFNTSLGCASNNENDESDLFAKNEYQTPIGHYPLPDIGMTIASNGSRVLVDHWSSDRQGCGLTWIDFAAPSSPTLVDSMEFEGSGSISALQWDGNFAYALQSYHLESETASGWISRLTEVSTGNNSLRVERTWDTPAFPYHMVQKDSTLYISTEIGVYVMDIETWTATLAFTFDTGIPGFMFITGDRLYLFGQSLGLATFDISSPSSPSQIGFFPFIVDFSPYIFAKNNIVAVSVDKELVLLDATDPNKPILLAPIDMGGYVASIVFREENAYIAAGDAGAYQVDASDLTSPKVLATCQSDFYVRNLALTDHLVIVSGFETGLSACVLIGN